MTRILITGRGTSGSWQMRGVQLGTAIGATVRADASLEDVRRADLVVLVKRPTEELLRRVRAWGGPLVWDVVDAWPQPAGNAWSRLRAVEWLVHSLSHIRPRAVVAATDTMRRDCPVDALWLPHHYQPGLAVNPVREVVRRVGYQGGAHYLGRWGEGLLRECARRGWELVLQPANLADVDIGVALRDVAGYPCAAWKSNVKLANLQGSGTPAIVCREQGYLETLSGAELVVDNAGELVDALDQLTSQAQRRWRAQVLYQSAVGLEVLAEKYRGWLEDLL